MSSQPRGLALTAGFLVLLTLTPLPTLPLVATASVLGAIAWGMHREGKARAAKARRGSEGPAGMPGVMPAGPAPEAPVETLLKVDTLELEIGYGLVPLVDKGQGGDLLDRISAIRRQLAVELGVVMPPVRIRDNMQLPSGEYRVKVRGNARAGVWARCVVD
jgi:flagellar biosynthesis protein FlhA